MFFRVNGLVTVIGITTGYLFLFSPRVLCAPSDNNFTYLALGDSVAFGLNPTLLVPNQPPPPPSVFTGYPEIIALVERLSSSNKEVNAACPGETSGSFMTAGAPDYGCHSLGPQGQPPFKSWVGLHTAYSGTQLQFAVSTLSADKHINLVTLGIGSNDFLLILAGCGQDLNCVNARVPGALQTYAAHLTVILGAIRAHYSGQLVLVGYYAPTADLIPLAQAINSTMTAVGSAFRARYADGFTAFQLAAAPFGGDVCKAGLLIRLDANTCDIHPSPLGRDLLAATVIAATLRP